MLPFKNSSGNHPEYAEGKSRSVSLGVLSLSRYWLISAKSASSLLLFGQYLCNETFPNERVLDLAAAYLEWFSV